MKFVDDPRQFAFGNPKATMKHATGAYRVNFALGTDRRRQVLGATSRKRTASTPLVLAEDRHYHADARVSVIDFTSKLEAPVAPYYRAPAAMGLPMHVSVAQLQPQLQAAGIDIEQRAGRYAAPLDAGRVGAAVPTLAGRSPLQYFFFADGLVSIEPKTGALIDVHAQREGVAVRPDMSGVAALQPLLDKYSAIPSVKASSDGLAGSPGRRRTAGRPGAPLPADVPSSSRADRKPARKADR